MLAAQGGGSLSPSPSDDEQPEEPIKKRKKPTTSTNDIVDISIMGGAFGGTGKGKKTQAELDEDAEIAWLEYQLRRGKRNGVDDDFGDDGLDGESSFGGCVVRWLIGGVDLLSFADKIVPDGEDDGEEMEDEEMDEDDMEEMPSDVDEVRLVSCREIRSASHLVFPCRTLPDSRTSKMINSTTLTRQTKTVKTIWPN